MRASVVLCTRDRENRLSRALEALAAMQVPPNVEWECLIVDNASRDATRATVDAFIRDDHPKFRYTYESEPGKTFALNRGIAEARGEILAFTDDDAIVAPNWLEAILDAFERYGADGVGGKVLPIWQAQRPDWLDDECFNVLALLDLGDEPFRIDWKKVRMLYGVNYAFHKRVFATVGNFNTVLGSRGEDQELFDRLALVDARVFYDSAIIVRHIIPGDRLTKRYYVEWYRASGAARAKLEPVGRLKVLGIPTYTMRQGLFVLAQFVTAAIMCDRRRMLRYWFRIQFFSSYYLGRMKTVRFRSEDARAR